MTAWFQFEAGRLWCGQIRDFLAAEKLKGRNITWHEGSGWVSRTFTVSGASDDVHQIKCVLAEFARRLKQAETTT